MFQSPYSHKETIMPFYIFNQNDTQRADFYQSQITDVEILWQGESLEAFEAKTGFSIAQLGGFKLTKGKLTYSQALKDAHDAPQVAPQTPQDKLRELTALISTLDDETQADLIDDSGRIIDALNFGKVGVAKVLVGRIDTQGDAQRDALKLAVLAILEA
jgi:hypothetical protein